VKEWSELPNYADYKDVLDASIDEKNYGKASDIARLLALD